MMEVLNFVFSSFWTWLGTFLIILAISAGIGSIRLVHLSIRQRGKDET